MLCRLIETSLGVNHVVVSLTTKGELGPYLQAKGIRVYELNLNAIIGFPVAFIKLVRLLRSEKPEVVQTWMVHSDLLGGLAARLVAVPHVIWGVRTTDYSVESKSTRAIRWCCAHLSSFIPDKIVCAAQASLKASIRAGYDSSKLLVIHNGFDVAELRLHKGSGGLIREQAGINPTHLVIGCLGRYNPAKDYSNFINAAGRIATLNPNCRFLMVGRDVESENVELISLINATGFSERFMLLGERSDPAACLDAMNIFVLSSCTEGFPNVLGEAMAMGLPCVTTDVGDASMLLGDAGLVVPPRDSLALYQAISSLLDLPKSELEKLGQKGQSRIEKNFSIHNAAARFVDLYHELQR